MKNPTAPAPAISIRQIRRTAITAEALILALDRGDLDWREMYK